MPLRDLDHDDRMRLMRFVCSFAWADLDVNKAERDFVARIIQRLHLDEADRLQVAKWLRVPPPVDEIDPTEIPAEHRQVFLDAVNGVVLADAHLSADERETLQLFRLLLPESPDE